MKEKISEERRTDHIHMVRVCVCERERQTVHDVLN